jgi:rhodanese-related sulfurtransferase
MKYCEYSGCSRKAEGILSFGGIKNYYCLKKVKRKLIGI